MSEDVGRQQAEEIVHQFWPWPYGTRGGLALTAAITDAITQAVELERQRCVAEHAAINALTRAQQGEIGQLRDAIGRELAR